MSSNGKLVETRESWDNERLDFDDETAYIQTSDEYDQLLSRAQMSVVDDMDIDTSARIVGPSGCGKTTLARSLAFDIKVANELINKHNIPVWEMNMNELTLFIHILKNVDNGKDEVCPHCGTGGSYYSRQNTTPEYRCNNCKSEFDETEKTESKSNLEVFKEIEENNNVLSELQDANLVDSSGNKKSGYPHSRAEAYRYIYEEQTGNNDIPSSPYFEITMSHAKYAKDLIGHPHIGENGTTFKKGKITEAVEASNDEPVVLTLDEINRAPTSAKDELYDALDGRVKVSMDEVGGVEIEGTPKNLIIVSTMNKGSGHHVEPLDFAEKRRLGSTYPVDFLGVEYPEKEVELIMDITGVPEDLAKEMVNTANEIRQTADNDGADLSYGVPTGTLIEWANEALTNNIVGIEKPVIQSGESAVAEAIYDHSADEVTKVNTIISKNMEGVDFFNSQDDEDDSSTNTNSNSESTYVCIDEYNDGCNWSKVESEAPQEAVQFLICPECDGAVEEQ